MIPENIFKSLRDHIESSVRLNSIGTSHEITHPLGSKYFSLDYIAARQFLEDHGYDLSGWNNIRWHKGFRHFWEWRKKLRWLVTIDDGVL